MCTEVGRRSRHAAMPDLHGSWSGRTSHAAMPTCTGVGLAPRHMLPCRCAQKLVADHVMLPCRTCMEVGQAGRHMLPCRPAPELVWLHVTCCHVDVHRSWSQITSCCHAGLAWKLVRQDVTCCHADLHRSWSGTTSHAAM